MKNRQVIIVGGGPVGLGLAIDLGQRGIDVLVFEKREKLHKIPKGQNLTQRSGEHFKEWGVMEEMEAARRVPASFGTAGVTAYGTLISDYHYDWLRRSDVAEYYSAENTRLPQYDTERVLRARVAELENVEVQYDYNVTGLEQTSDGVVVNVTTPDGKSKSVKGRYAIGCDGARSIVRETVGMTQSFKSNKNRMVLCVFKSEELHKLLERYENKSYFNALHPRNKGYWQFLGRVDLSHTWFFHAPVPEDSQRGSFDLEGCLFRAVGKSFKFEAEYLGFWDLRIAIADNYRIGNIFIAGDSAHSHPPYGGLGVNNGFEDVRNLSWKLEASLKGWGSDALLESYSTERQPVFNSTADDFIARMIREDGEFLKNYNPEKDKHAFEAEWYRRAEDTKKDVENFVPHYSGSQIVVGAEGETSAWGVHTHQALAGYHLSPQDDVLEQLGRGFSLISIGDNKDAIEQFSAVAGNLNVPLDIVETAKTPNTDKWRARLILVRPDHFVAFATDELDEDAATVIKKSVGRD